MIKPFDHHRLYHGSKVHHFLRPAMSWPRGRFAIVIWHMSLICQLECILWLVCGFRNGCVTFTWSLFGVLIKIVRFLIKSFRCWFFPVRVDWFPWRGFSCFFVVKGSFWFWICVWKPPVDGNQSCDVFWYLIIW